MVGCCYPCKVGSWKALSLNEFIGSLDNVTYDHKIRVWAFLRKAGHISMLGCHLLLVVLGIPSF